MNATLKYGTFSGAFAVMQTYGFGLAKRMGYSHGVAHKIGMDFGSDYGRMLRNDPKFVVKIGKAKKDGMSTFAVAIKGATLLTNTMRFLNVGIALDELKSRGFLASIPPIPAEHFAETVQEYLLACEAWVTANPEGSAPSEDEQLEEQTESASS